MAVLLATLALSACNPVLTARSLPPPGRTARLDEVLGFWGTIKSYRVEVSRGVALAVSCSYLGGPCEHLHATSDDPAIAEVRAASLGVLERSSFTNQQPSAALVVVGKTAGITHIHVVSHEGERDIRVTVVTEGLTTPRIAVR